MRHAGLSKYALVSWPTEDLKVYILLTLLKIKNRSVRVANFGAKTAQTP